MRSAFVFAISGVLAIWGYFYISGDVAPLTSQQQERATGITRTVSDGARSTVLWAAKTGAEAAVVVKDTWAGRVTSDVHQ